MFSTEEPDIILFEYSFTIYEGILALDACESLAAKLNIFLLGNALYKALCERAF
jgi:uncharacterized protein YjaG (DUF416 family)